MAATNTSGVRDWVAFENTCRRNLSKAMDLDQKGERNEARLLYMSTGKKRDIKNDNNNEYND